MAAELERALELVDARPAEAVQLLRAVALAPLPPGGAPSGPDDTKTRETAVTSLTAVLAKQRDAPALRALLGELRPLFSALPKAKTAKLVRTIIDAVATIPDTTALQVELCREQVEWTKAEKRTFLRHRVELRLASLYVDTQEYTAALALIASLLTEVKRLDDKLLLVDIHLLESKVHYALRSMAKSKAALTAGRTAANAIYVPPATQAAIDNQSGILHAHEKDYKTAYSYFFESFEQQHALGEAKALLALKYMALCKVMAGSPEDVAPLLAAKAGLAYQGPDLDAMKAVATASAERSLAGLQAALEGYAAQLKADPIVASHLEALYDSLLERNLGRLIEPFSVVETAHVAQLIGLPLALVERKLSQMVLDKQFEGMLDQGAGCLRVFDKGPKELLYTAALDTVSNLTRVVDVLSSSHKAKLAAA